jgi:hypothetical protein
MISGINDWARLISKYLTTIANIYYFLKQQQR